MIKLDVIKPKLSRLVDFLKELEEVKPAGSFSEYKATPSIKRSSERLIQLIVEVAADVNSNIVVGLGQPAPKDYYDTFIKAGEVRLISKTLARKLAPWAGLRNRIVHEYEEIKDKLVFDKIEPTITNFRKYIREVKKFIEAKERR